MLIESGKLVLDGQYDWLILTGLFTVFSFGFAAYMTLAGQKIRRKREELRKEKSATELLTKDGVEES